MSTVDEGRARAREQVEKIAEDHGYLGEDVLRQMAPDVRRKVERALFNKDQIIASSVIALAKTVYTSSARFVFELLQNADDNSYTKARGRKQEPSVSFYERPDSIVMECNEDGFTSENLVAICNVNRSSKQGAQGYIGEKGIGFKSVFMSAYKVHIQSGYFSFSFTHRQGDSGFGMISPVWEEEGDFLGDGLTRMTLFLREDGDDEAKAMRLDSIRKQFRDMNETFLLFTKNIKQIQVDSSQGAGQPDISTSYLLRRPSSQRALLQKTVQEGDKTSTDSKHFHVTEYDATNLAKNENRTYSAAEEGTKAYSRAKVVLAFPLDMQSKPDIKPQKLFAFLPVRHVGLNFIVHSDWVTLTSRENIVSTSPRNRGLIGAVADAFLAAVLEFCQHESLQYQWMRYLPSQSDIGHFDSIWVDLTNEISARLKSIPVLRSRSNRLSFITQLRRNCTGGLDGDGNPLFGDIEPEVYLSPRYTSSDLNHLQRYGLQTMTVGQVIDRARADLQMAPSQSRFLSGNTSEDWHSRAAKLFYNAFDEWGPQIRTLTIIPTRNKIENRTLLVPACRQPIWHPECEGLPIPEGLGLTVLHSGAATNSDRLRLYLKLGVQRATVGDIRKKILAMYPTTNGITKGGTFLLSDMSRQQLHFLYLTHHLKENNEPEKVEVYTSCNTFVCPRDWWVYYPDDKPYGPTELFRLAPRGTAPGSSNPEDGVQFIHQLYLQTQPETPKGQNLGWADWLTDYLRVEARVRILRSGSLSDPCKYIAKHRPEKFLGFLQAHWDIESAQLLSSKAAVDELRDINVLCEGNKTCKLSDCYFPTKELRSRVKKYLLDDEFLPFLQIPGDGESPLSLWTPLLEGLRFGRPINDLAFALEIMRRILEANADAYDLKKPLRVLKLYEYIRFALRDTGDAFRSGVRDLFNARPSIYIPATTESDATWFDPRDCLWHSPIDLIHSTCLEMRYTTAFQDQIDISDLQRFFVDVLEVTDATWEDIVREIVAEKAREADINRVTELYRCLASLPLSPDDERKLRNRFESEPLVLVDDDGIRTWCSTSGCLWSSKTKIHGKATLVDMYKDLRDFFVDLLGVSNLTLKMLYDELSIKKTSSSIDEVKKALLEFNSLIPTQTHLLDPGPILKAPVFPVRYPDGQRKLSNSKAHFAFVDRQPLADEFASQAAFFDFSLQETHQLKPFLDWVGLDDRYLSESVKFITSVAAESARPVSNPSHRLSTKARALLSFAMHVGSPRVRGTLASQDAFVALLRASEVLETDEIVSQMLLHQDKPLSVTRDRGDLHIDDGVGEKPLRVYMPRTRRRRDACFHTVLPRELLRWIMATGSDAAAESPPQQPGWQQAASDLKSILATPPAALPDVLAELGIPQVGEPDDFDDDDDDDDEEAAAGVSAVADAFASLALRPATPPRRAGSDDGSADDDDDDGDVADIFTPSATAAASGSPVGYNTPFTEVGTPASSAFYYPSPSSMQALRRPPLFRSPAAAATAAVDPLPAFRRMLDRAVRAARSGGGAMLPQAGSEAILRDPEPPAGARDRLFASSAGESWEWKKLVGVAGELFVFEYLSNLRPCLPGFGRPCWQSRLRARAAVHASYADLTPWSGCETTDIVYDDVDGALTAMLVDAGHLDGAAWRGQTPIYGIEVKSTEGDCDIPFFVSREQQKLMRDWTLGTYRAENTRHIYIVFRVFKLRGDEIGLKLYVDPEGMRQRRELEFNADKYEVTPSVRA